MREMNKQNFSRQQKLVYVIMIIGLVLLIIANIFAWLYLQRVESFFISDLKFRLENIARSASALIDANDVELIIPGNVSDPQVLYYQQILFEIKSHNKLQDIEILSRDLRKLVDTDPIPDVTDPGLVIDTVLTTKALQGEYVVGNIQYLGENIFLRAIAPLINTDNLISGLLILEAPAEFFSTLDQYNKSLTIFSFINGMVILGVAILIYRSIRRVIRLQDQMRNQEHMAKLGEMAAAVAHEIRNPLSIIKGTNSLLQKKYQSGDDELFDYIPDELDRLNELIEDFLTFARSREPQYQPVVIEDLITRVRLGFLENEKFSIAMDIDAGLTQIRTDPDMLEQILLNIIQNSFQATGGEGTIHISVRENGPTVKFEISDDGQGIDHSILPRIFEPFYSGREKGSGLGLAISKQLCEQLGGDIQIASEVNKGTTVSLELPVKEYN